MKRSLALAAVLVTAACGHNTLTNPDGSEALVVSQLGFRVEGSKDFLEAGNAVTQQHADLADRWWTSLMADLRRAGYSETQTDPVKHTSWVFVLLVKPEGPNSYIMCPMHNALVGGCYDQFKPSLHVPGDYTDPDGWLGDRPTAQPLKHEMTHHWCLKTLGHLCMPDGKHEFRMPNGVNIWDVQWYDAYPPAAAAARATATARTPCSFTGVQ